MTDRRPERKKLKLAVMGMGVRGRHWAEAISDAGNATLEAVVDPVGAEGFPSESVFSEPADAINRGVDGVVVASPPHSHLELVELCLRAGLPTLCEKPLSESYTEAMTMADLSKQTGVPLLVGMNFRYVESVRDKKELVDNTRFGLPMFGHFTYIRNRDGRRPDLNDYPLTMDNPMLVEQSIHHLDLLRYVYGMEAQSVQAHSWNPPSSVYVGDTCVAAIIEFEEGLVVNYIGTWASGSSHLDYRWRTDFERGSVVQPGQFGGLLAARLDETMSESGPMYGLDDPPMSTIGGGPSVPFHDDTRALLRHFTDVIEGSSAPGPTAQDHLKTLQLVDAIARAAETGHATPVGI